MTKIGKRPNMFEPGKQDSQQSGTSEAVVPLWGLGQNALRLGFIVLMIIAGISIFAPPDRISENTSAVEFSAERAMTHIAAIAQHPHPMGSPEIAEVRTYLLAQLESMGANPETQEQIVDDFYGINAGRDTVIMANILARIPGTASTGAVALMGHYDTVPATPGANDNAAAVAAMLETARALLSDSPQQNDVILIFTDGEEPFKRYGARAIVGQHRWLQDIALIMNFEAIGSSGATFMFETSLDNGWLIREFSRGAPYPTAFSFTHDLFKAAPGSTDFAVFRNAGIAGLNFAYFNNPLVYHTALDNLDNVDPRSVQHQGSYMLALTRHFGNLDLQDLQNASTGDAVYFPLLTALVYYPAVWALPLAILAGLLLISVIALGFKNRQISVLRMGLGIGVSLISIVVLSVLGSLAWWIIIEFYQRNGVIVGIAQGNLYLVGLLLLTSVGSGAIHILFERKWEISNLQAGMLLWWWILALMTALFIPGFSYLFVWTLLAGILSLGWTFWRQTSMMTFRRHFFSMMIIAAPGIIILAPPVYTFFLLAQPRPGNLDSQLIPAIGASIFLMVMLLGLLIPQLATVNRAHKWKLIGAELLVAIGFLVIASLAPGVDITLLGL